MAISATVSIVGISPVIIEETAVPIILGPNPFLTIVPLNLLEAIDDAASPATNPTNSR
jgi:hypothetical protein